MLLTKLAKATSTGSQNNSPRSAGSSSKRATLEIFETFRSPRKDQLIQQHDDEADAASGSPTEAEIEAMLDQNLFREVADAASDDQNEEYAASASLLKQFQIASDVANDILDDGEPDFNLPNKDDFVWRSPTTVCSPQVKQEGVAAMADAFTAECFISPEQVNSFGGISSQNVKGHQQSSIDVIKEQSSTMEQQSIESSIFCLPSSDMPDQKAAPSLDLQATQTPKKLLNAQTLFAFGAGEFSNAFSCSGVGDQAASAASQNKFFQNNETQANTTRATTSQQPGGGFAINPWNASGSTTASSYPINTSALNTAPIAAPCESNKVQQSSQSVLVDEQQHSLDVVQVSNIAVEHPFWPKSTQSGKKQVGDQTNTTNSANTSLTEDIFAGAFDTKANIGGQSTTCGEVSSVNHTSFTAASNQQLFLQDNMSLNGTMAGPEDQLSSSQFLQNSFSYVQINNSFTPSQKQPPQFQQPKPQQQSPQFQQPVQQPQQFYPQQSCSPFTNFINVAQAPAFKPFSAKSTTFIFKGHPQNQQQQQNPAQAIQTQFAQMSLQQQTNAAANTKPVYVGYSDFQSTYAGSSMNRSDTASTSAEYAGNGIYHISRQHSNTTSAASGPQQQFCYGGHQMDHLTQHQGMVAQAMATFLELPKHLEDELTSDELEIVKNIELMVYDQTGCRMVQRKLEENEAEKREVFAASLVHIMYEVLPEVMMNQFGNYLCQKLIEVCSVDSLKLLVKAVVPSLVDISMDLHGTRCIQTLVEVLGVQPAALHSEILAIGAEMSQCIFDLTTHPNGNHVIQALLLTFKASDEPEQTNLPGAEKYATYTDFIYRACMDYCGQIGSDKHGCCVMQRCLEKGLVRQKLALADVIISRIHLLIEDPFGNYLVQNVLKLKSELRNNQILNFIAGDFVRLSQLKFSSNVIEKCLETDQAAYQIDQMLKGTHYWDDQSLFRELGALSRNQEIRVNLIVQRLVTHQFGNYVLQKAITIVVDENLRLQILEAINRMSGSLCQTKYGNKVLNKLQKTYPKVFSSNAQTSMSSNSQQTTASRKNQNGFSNANNCQQQDFTMQQQAYKKKSNGNGHHHSHNHRNKNNNQYTKNGGNGRQAAKQQNQQKAGVQ